MRIILYLTFLAGTLLCGCTSRSPADDTYADVIGEPGKIEMFWKDSGQVLKSIGNLKTHVEHNGRKLRFAMNGGMYQEDQKPLGLFIQNGKVITPVNTRKAEGNFYLMPNGVFGIESGHAFVVKTEDFIDNGSKEFATQSGPMLIVDGAINERFARDSSNRNIRNGVCVLDDGRVLFSISKKAVSFYEFAVHFRDRGCRNALYLDGFVSRMYAPEIGMDDFDGDFGVILAITE
ncbi:MAG TPA: phosphodiester glycosidase family protein [Pyrinomonadaceae bacterium]|jgi:uncharacterized protein YigE (DUF2233 family)|nr:phosphodiester glycosidase family protein [Pyrinomonadaceae bacterium]